MRNEMRHRSEGKAFVRLLFLCMLPLVLLAICAECYMRLCVPNSYRTKSEMMMRMADSVQTIVLGNSHAYSGIRPALLPGVAVNLANVSQTAPIDLELLKRYAPVCPNLSHVYLVADNSYLFDAPLETTDEWFRITYYTLYMNRLGGHSPWSRYGLELAHWDSFKGKLIKYWEECRPDCDSLGWDTDNRLESKSQEEWNRRQAEDALRRHTCQDRRWARLNARAVLDMARYCHSHGIRLTLLCTPVSPTYAAGIPTRQRAFIQKLHLVAQQQFGAESMDLTTMPLYPEDYFDGDHLTHEGAAKLTRLLGD